MSDFYPDPEPSPDPAFRDLDDCPMKPSLIRGGAVAFVLTLFPFSLFICCLPLILAALVGVFDYTKRYGISLGVPQGMKVGVLCCLVGYGLSILFYVTVWAVFDHQIGMETYQSVFRSFLENLPPEIVDDMGDEVTDSIDEMGELEFHVGMLVQQIFGLILTSAIGGCIGGLIGSAMFKKGPEAK